ncbi:DNA-binding transcriptional activator FeaR [compost metagenome]
MRADLCNPRYSALSVSEIAYRAGFNNASHFSRSFKQRYGAAPSSYRSSELARA